MTIFGEGEYNLNSLNEVKVTDSFLGLDLKTRKCQNKEPFENCTTRQYSEIFKKCGCKDCKVRI